MPETIHTIDSHTAGEPTRVVVRGGPDLGSGPAREKQSRLQESFDQLRTAVVREPRGSDVLVGALLCEPHDSSCDVAVIFFNNVGYLGMCGHGLIGVVETLRYLGRFQVGDYRIETPVGVVSAALADDGGVTIQNVVSYRREKDVAVHVDGVGRVVGDIAWGGNWFFLVREPKQELAVQRTAELKDTAMKIRHAVNEAGHPEVDHVELFGLPASPESDSRNFVLCPGLEYDRSPCGTGTSAKIACLAADGKLLPGETWVQEGILGTQFRAHFRWSDAHETAIVPTITGRAFVTAKSELLLDDADPFRYGIGSGDHGAQP